jgi:hypothetical protein
MGAEHLTPFKPGASGNPSGRPKIPDDIKKILKLQAPNALQKLLTLMESNDERIALTAANCVLDRAWGKPAQSTEISGPDGEAIEVRDVTPLDIARRIAFALANAERPKD